MIPSLVARELRTALVEYLATTFALADDDAYAALSRFLLDPREGIFRGPFLRIRLPFVDAPEGAQTGLDWTPGGFRPYAHQLLAWRRLGTREGAPRPTLITTGTGSGKSEGFLVPVIDHCIRARREGMRGIKALLLYPMNALVTDQEGRIARMLTDSRAREAGVRGGVWIGDDGSVSPRREMTDSNLISDTEALRADPPDILLTNYKMLDRLLTNESRQRLWAANTPPPGHGGGWQQPLTYLVLDEFHTYDGAQGTDVAMLLRRLGHRLGIATSSSPLEGVGCVGTSATLGSSPTAAAEMLDFASKVFGVPFGPDAIVGEQRRTVQEVCGDLDFGLPTPRPEDVAALAVNDVDALARAFTGHGFDDAAAVGDRLLRHRITASLLRLAADHPRSWPDLLQGLGAQVPEWGQALERDEGAVEVALERFVGLVSRARGRVAGGASRPLFAVEVQVWIREVTRLTRALDRVPRFRWADSPGEGEETALMAPSVYCTSCGRSGWLAVANRAGGQGGGAIERLVYDGDSDPYQVALRDRPRTRTLIRASASEDDVLFLDPGTGQVHSIDDGKSPRIPVLVAGMTGETRTEEARDDAARRQKCPSCGTNDAIRFLGSRVSTLASVGITQMFGSESVADDERKLLAFTDSVQDASHRAAFFSGRTHRFNLRATLSGVLQEAGRIRLPDVAPRVVARALQGEHPADDLFSLVPPDLLWEDALSAAWERPGTREAEEAERGLELRLGFDAVMEAGLRSRLGRTLETTGTAIPRVVVAGEEWVQLVKLAAESIRAHCGFFEPAEDEIRTWIHGVLERMRLRGGIFHPFLDAYVADHGKRWRIWGGGDPLAPKFPKGISAPAYFATPTVDDLDPIAGSQSWVGMWTRKVLTVEGAGADRSIRDLLNFLVRVGVVEERSTGKGSVWGLPAERVEFVDVPGDPGPVPDTELHCSICAHRHYADPELFELWRGRPCMRLRCTGQYRPARQRPTNYYRALYRSGKIRRVVAAEHTGLLSRKQRERVESGFRDGGRPDAPNVLAATPTLEMGIDIGDLSAVMLTAVPPTQANYVQRVGRAGRRTGNAFVTTFAEGDPRSLYFLHEPEQMISGEITPPNCYLDAIEILRRQYLAFLVDQAAMGPRGPIPGAGEMPRTIGRLAEHGLRAGGWMDRVLEAGQDPETVARFIGLFGHHLDPRVGARLGAWSASDMRLQVERVIDRWRTDLQVTRNQRDRLRERERELAALKNPTEEDREAQGRVMAELRHVAAKISRAAKQDTLGALEALGLLPNYTLFDESVTLEVNLWRRNENHDPGDEQSRRYLTLNEEYVRGASVAIRELAPGNWFYVNAHRVRVDAVDIGTESEPSHRPWRLCPACSWGLPESGERRLECPRCGSPGVADQGARVTVLPMRVVSSTEPEVTARVSDDREDRDREWHEVAVSVDVPREEVTAAYLHSKATFGVEAARAARIRYLNLGLHGSRGGAARQFRIDGKDRTASLFTVCPHCGGVFGIRGNPDDTSDPNHHRSWCKVRSGARAEQWDPVALVHELVTEAVRILLPVADFEAAERVASFKAALLLGLRDSFGGAPDHLRVIQSDFPAADGGEDRVRFVVVHDTVPGGTGYLPRLADPERLRIILERARKLIAGCECQTRGRPGCHKCLYMAAGRNEIPKISREIALQILDEILKEWHLKAAPDGTITGVSLTGVRQSELERMFKALLHRWSGRSQATITGRPDPDHAVYTRFDIRFKDGPHWEVREQVNLATHGTRPDFYATRVDAAGTPPVAIYLDGWEYHGARPEQVDLDAERRASLRAAGTLVWVLTWNDVKEALYAATQGKEVARRVPLPPTARRYAGEGARAKLGGHHPAFEALDLGPFEQLLWLMRHPELEIWRHLAETTALAPARDQGKKVPVRDLRTATEQAARGERLTPAEGETGVAAVEWESIAGFGVMAVLEKASGTIGVVLSYDTRDAPDQDRWTDWLHLSNMSQYMGEKAVITTTRSFTTVAQGAGADDGRGRRVGGVLGGEAELGEIFDPRARELAAAALSAGFGALRVGMSAGDRDDTPVEAAWPDRRVGILAAKVGRPGTLADWDLRPSDEWTVDELIAALKGKGD